MRRFAQTILLAGIVAGAVTLAVWLADSYAGSFIQLDVESAAVALLPEVPFAEAVLKAVTPDAEIDARIARLAFLLVFAATFLPSLGLIAALRGGKPSAVPRLTDLLVQPSEKRDAWQRLVVPVELVGREQELLRLSEFAARPNAFAWQTLHGSHAVGKSRLAQEWLLGLERSREKWTVGFWPDAGTEAGAESILAVRPKGPIAIVIDNAAGLGDQVWTLLDRAQQQWSKTGCKVRFLLLAHSDMAPASENFDRDERLREAREARLVTVLQVERSTGGSAAAPAPERVALPGIGLPPLSDMNDQARVVKLAAAQAGVAVSAAEIDKACREAEGRPAFLALAGRYPRDWHQKLKEYAVGIVRKADGLFGPDVDDGRRVLILSALAGGVDGAVRESIAPRAWPANKLADLFSVSADAAAANVPVFEPDLLAQEVVFAALPSLSPTDQRALCARIAQASPDRFLEKVTGMWLRRAEAPELAGSLRRLIATQTRDEATREAATLECLFEAAANAVPRGTQLPFAKLSTARGAVFVRTVVDCSPISDAGYAALVSAALSHTSPDSVARYLADVHGDIACDARNHQDWAILLSRYCGSGWLPEEILDRRIFSGLGLSETEAEKACRGLQSADRFERAMAAFRVAEALRDRKAPPRDMLPAYDRILDALSAMVRRSGVGDRLSAVFALNWVVREASGRAGGAHLRPRDIAALTDALHDRRSTPSIIMALSSLFGHAFRTLSPETEFEGWLSGSTLRPPEAPPEFEMATEIGDSLLTLLRDGGYDDLVRSDLALACARVGRVSEDVCQALAATLAMPLTSARLRYEIVARLGRQPPALALPVLVQIARSERRDDRTLAVAALLWIGGAEAIEALEAADPNPHTDLDLAGLAAEARARAQGGGAPGPLTIGLRDQMRDMRIRGMGHLIHKLKAKDTTGRWAYYFVLVETEREEAFLASIKAIEGEGTIDLEDYGVVVASNYGEEPSEEVRDYLKERYGFDV